MADVNHMRPTCTLFARSYTAGLKKARYVLRITSWYLYSLVRYQGLAYNMHLATKICSGVEGHCMSITGQLSAATSVVSAIGIGICNWWLDVAVL